MPLPTDLTHQSSTSNTAAESYIMLLQPNPMSKTERVNSGFQQCQIGSEIGRHHSSSTAGHAVPGPIEALTATEEATFAALKIRWFGLHPDQPMTDEMILRFARSHRFREQSAWAAMRALDCRYLTLSARGLEKQLKNRVRAAKIHMVCMPNTTEYSLTVCTSNIIQPKQLVFPLPAISTQDGQECFYMRHSRFNPVKSPVEDAIDPLVYVINTMNDKESNMRNGIALISNFDGWTVNQSSMEHFSRLVSVLQGVVVPVNLSSWLIVNAPPSFNQVLVEMKRTMSAAFQKRMHLIVTDEALAKFLKRGYRNHLPRGVARGRAVTKEIVSDFIDARVHIESFQYCTAARFMQKETPRDTATGRATTKEFVLNFPEARRCIKTVRDCLSDTLGEKGNNFHASESSSTDFTFDCSTTFHGDELITWTRIE
jgi:CRAL/TRIO domain